MLVVIVSLVSLCAGSVEGKSVPKRLCLSRVDPNLFFLRAGAHFNGLVSLRAWELHMARRHYTTELPWSRAGSTIKGKASPPKTGCLFARTCACQRQDFVFKVTLRSALTSATAVSNEHSHLVSVSTHTHS